MRAADQTGDQTWQCSSTWGSAHRVTHNHVAAIATHYARIQPLVSTFFIHQRIWVGIIHHHLLGIAANDDVHGPARRGDVLLVPLHHEL
jgi:hypothetical protein